MLALGLRTDEGVTQQVSTRRPRTTGRGAAADRLSLAALGVLLPPPEPGGRVRVAGGGERAAGAGLAAAERTVSAGAAVRARCGAVLRRCLHRALRCTPAGLPLLDSLLPALLCQLRRRWNAMEEEDGDGRGSR